MTTKTTKMTKKTMQATIRAIGVGFPKTVRDNAWFRERYPEVFAELEGKTLARVFTAAGSNERSARFDDAMARFLRDPFRGTVQRRALDADVSPIDLQADVARATLAAARLTPKDVDLALVSAFPTTEPGVGDGVFLARALGITAPAINVESACSGGLAALQMAAGLVASGQARRVLVVVSCIYSRACDWSDSLTWFLGDGVGCYVVTASDGDDEGFVAFHGSNTADSCGSFVYRYEDGAAGVRPIIRAGEGASRALRDMTPAAIKDVVAGALARAELDVADIDFFVPNTPLAWFAEMFSGIVGAPPERTVSTYAEYANMGPALNPVNLHRALSEGRIAPGANVLLFSIGSVSSAMSAVVRLGRVAVAEAVYR